MILSDYFKEKTKSRLVIEAVSFCVLCLFWIVTPFLGDSNSFRTPSVKGLFIVAIPEPQSKGLPEPALSATSVFIQDVASGKVLFQINPHQQLKPASLTKIMTALVAMDHYSEGSVLRVMTGQKAVGSSIKLRRGDELSAEAMFYALLVPSGNDAAVTLAENYPGGYSAFIQQMNTKVQQLGLTNTHFANVSGVEGPNHYTSAYDIAQMALEGLKRPLFANIVSTKQVTVKSLSGHPYVLQSTNILLGQPGVLGIKTGWTPEAGECLVTYVERDGHKVIISILGSKDRFGETENLISWVFQNFTW